MTKEEAIALVDEIEATIEHKIAGRLDGILAELRDLRSENVRLGNEIGALRGENAGLRQRIEEVAKEPRVHIEPQFNVPVPAVHLAPTIQQAPRKSRNVIMKKMPDGSFQWVEDSQ